MNCPDTECPASDGHGDEPVPKRRATVFDATAGRVSQPGVIPLQSVRSSKYTSAQPFRPDEVLFRQKNAPTRYAETDFYFANTHLGADQALPCSDLLNALHAYVSKFYASSSEKLSEKAWKSMDETALIALGILVEETVKEVLGETGELAFLGTPEDSPEPSSAGDSALDSPLSGVEGARDATSTASTGGRLSASGLDGETW
ncbi:hypothetical protein K469DRAFT_695370 [Zopfia rhizophila CBS 207.26]|uniref:Uncharacterized protein n=1 Tax=Zopfia rhizophila CBS 207.26 TaxID=1314779 RepID=A0A6A6DI22_9PEZI|nr:hypothetical protein K469DRAFT_695370 [Zopfia rhizophila CBS 207.26]